MELVRWEQVEGVNRIQSRIHELFEDALGRTRAQQNAAAAVWYPPVDILESKDSYLIRAELPGMRKEDLKTEVNEGILTLSGERKLEEPASGVEYHRVERVTGKFSRSLRACYVHVDPLSRAVRCLQRVCCVCLFVEVNIRRQPRTEQR